MAGVELDFPRLLAMRLRKVNAKVVVEALIRARQGGLKEVTVDMVEAHWLVGGRVEEVVQAMIEMKQAGKSMSWSEVAALDLADLLRESNVRKLQEKKDAGENYVAELNKTSYTKRL